MKTENAEIVIVGAGIVGIATAYYLATRHGRRGVVLLDPLPPMSLTSAASGENYRNWWPHPTMTAFTDYSIDLMEAIARDSGNSLHMTRRGYALASRRTSLDAALRQLRAGYGQDGAARIRVHRKGAAARYLAAAAAGWEDAPDGVDVVDDPDLIRRAFPSFDPEVSLVLHVRRAGDIAGQQMGQHMMEQIRAAGGRIVPARVIAAGGGDRFDLEIEGRDGAKRLSAEILVDAAGPYLAEVAAMLGEDLPVATVAQQKIAFEDSAGAIPRDMPFAIDLDGQTLDWSEEERALLREEPATSRFAEAMPGGVHCRPDGGAGGRWVKLGWAFNRSPGRVEPTPPLDPHFPEIVLRGASRLNPGLKAYYGRLPRQVSHYGGYYTMTRENWPLIGPLRTPGAFVAGALSGFGTMGACAAGACCAAWICGGVLPGFARNLSLARYEDAALMAEVAALESTGVL